MSDSWVDHARWIISAMVAVNYEETSDAREGELTDRLIDDDAVGASADPLGVIRAYAEITQHLVDGLVEAGRSRQDVLRDLGIWAAGLPE